MTDALLEVLKDRVDWDLRPKEANDWATTVAGRIRAMCRRLTQAEIKSPRAPWLRRFGATPPKRDFISERLHGKQRFFHAKVDRGWRERGGCARDRGERFIGHARDTARRGHMQTTAAATTADLGICSFVLQGVGRRGRSAVRYRLSLDGKHREQQTWSKDLQVHLGCVFFFFARTMIEH